MNELYRVCRFFQFVIDHVMLELARMHLTVAE